MSVCNMMGIIPAAGKGERLRPFSYPKELLPVAYSLDTSEAPVATPRLLIDCALDAIAATAATRCVVVVAPWKYEVINQISAGRRAGLQVAYVLQEEARGLAPAVDLAFPWVADAHVAFVMPDTLIAPSNCMADLREVYCVSNPDLLLGVFPTKEASRLGPVLLKGQKVLSVYDKVPSSPVSNTWGCAMWGPRFTELLHSELQRCPDREGISSLGGYFDLAVRRGLSVEAVYFEHARYLDLGTPEGISQWIRAAGPNVVLI